MTSGSFKGAVDQSRRRYPHHCEGALAAGVASKGPSIRVDGDCVTRGMPYVRLVLQRGRRSESTEISTTRHRATSPSAGFKGAVDQSRRRCGGRGTHYPRGQNASKGPSIRVDGDDQQRHRPRVVLGASKGPSIRVDGDIFVGSWCERFAVRLQRGRRSESTEISTCTTASKSSRPLQRGRRSESTEIFALPRARLLDRLASKGPSIRVDGDLRAVSERLDHSLASKGPSIRVDGDLF